MGCSAGLARPFQAMRKELAEHPIPKNAWRCNVPWFNDFLRTLGYSLSPEVIELDGAYLTATCRSHHPRKWTA